MGILIMAGIATVLAPLLLAWPIRRLSSPTDRRWLLLAFVVALPLHPLAYHALRVPLHQGLTALLGPGPVLSTLTLSYAPLTEEPAKWLALLPVFLLGRIAPANALAMALSAGLGFAIGEFWFLALRIAPTVDPALPFYIFTGFLFERMEVAFLHGAFILWFARALGDRRAPLLGGLAGMGLHFICNAPIVLVALDPFGLGREVWLQVVTLWVLLLTVALLTVLRRMARAEGRGEILGTSTCPECHAVYPRPLLTALNLGTVRLERCPSCRHWHRVPMRAGKAPA